MLTPHCIGLLFLSPCEIICDAISSWLTEERSISVLIYYFFTRDDVCRERILLCVKDKPEAVMCLSTGMFLLKAFGSLKS